LQTRKLMKKNSYNSETRTVQAIAATESPVEVFDWELGRIREILLMSGAKYPEQVPVLDSHDRHSVGQVLGSATGFNILGDDLHCSIELSKESRADGTALKISEGHLTDLSIGYEVLREDMVDEGQTKFYGSKAIEGPVRVCTEWRIRELSICPIGADSRAKIRSYQGVNKMEDKNTQVRTEAEIRAAERERVAEISHFAARLGLEELGRKMIENGATAEDAKARFMDFIMRTEEPGPRFIPEGRFSLGFDDTEKRSEAIVDGLTIREGYGPEKPAPGANEFVHMPLMEIARQCLQMNGQNARGMSNREVLKHALSMRTHTTSDFPFILANVANKVLRKAYELTPSTFQSWTVKDFASDYKELSRVALSEAPNLDVIPEATEYSYGSFGESKEVYSVVKHGKMFRISDIAIANDDLGAFTRTSRAFVASAKRGLNNRVYQELTNNANMSDGIPLFHADHDNLAANGATISIGTLSAARLAMRTQTGLQTDDPLNIAPKFLIVPAKLETYADQVINTQLGYDADAGPGTTNPWYKKLVVITESFLDTVDPDAWYLAGDPRMIDTVAIAYLDGREEPFVEWREDWLTDGVELKCRFSYGVKALDFRGVYMNEGN
jgi:hypothetical protein